MAYDARLVEGVRVRLARTDGVTELKMFGGWGVTIHGNMAVGVMGDDLILRVGPKHFEELVRRPGARPFDFTGRPMTGWLFVDQRSVANGRSLGVWVDRGVAYARSLPRKTRDRNTRPPRPQ